MTAVESEKSLEAAEASQGKIVGSSTDVEVAVVRKMVRQKTMEAMIKGTTDGALTEALATIDRDVARTANKEASPKDTKELDPDDEILVMGRYLVQGVKNGAALLGEGGFSRVWRATDTKTKQTVALKTYKVDRTKDDTEDECLIRKQFNRQVAVLKYLQAPLSKKEVLDSNPDLWHDMFEVESCFSLKLLDFSQDAHGRPDQHSDGHYYVITELAEYSLKDLIESKYDANEKFTDDEIQFIASSCILCVAGLHAKNRVHLDFKPENIVVCAGKFKLIDLDGALPIQQELSWQDNTISFTPAYCSPEFAKFMHGKDEWLKIEPSMDVWSVGLSLCQLVTLKNVLSQENRRLLGAQALNSGPAIIDWLCFKCRAGPLKLPPAIGEFNADFLAGLNSILIGEPLRRSTLAQLLKSPYFAQGLEKIQTYSAFLEGIKFQHSKHIVKHDASLRCSAMYKGMLRKLNSDGDPTKKDHWRKRDFWIAENASLCYFSKQHDKAMVLIDRDDLRCASFRVVDDVENLAYPHVFEIQLIKEQEEEAVWLATDSPDQIDSWIDAINYWKRNTFNFQNVFAIRLKVNNRRGEVPAFDKVQYHKVFESKLWKLNQDGDPTKEDDWRLRDMWLAQNGSICYYSRQKQKDLQYHCASDMQYAVVQKLEHRKTVRGEEVLISAKKHAFTISLPSKGEMEYEPSVFAAQSEEECDEWIKEISKVNRGRHRAPLRSKLSGFL